VLSAPPRLSPCERLEGLCDPGTLTLSPAPSSGVAVVAGHGRVNGRTVGCYAHDFSIAGGSVGEAEAALVVEVLRESRTAGRPVVAFMESAGARLQEGVAALGAYASIFSENVAAARVVPQLSVITGTAAGGGCYSPALTDFIVMTRASSMFLTGPRVVREALHEDIEPLALGGSRVHERNGVCHLVAADDSEALMLARELLGHLPARAGGPLWVDAPQPPAGGAPDAPLPAAPSAAYDVREVIAALADGGRLLEVSPRWARNLVTGFARIQGLPIGVLASQPRHLGGILDAPAARKGSAFVEACDAYGVPMLVLVDTPGFMPGRRQEAEGIIRHGAGLVRAFAAARVPKVSVVLRKAYGGAYIAMNSKRLGADLALAWPGAEIGIMGGRAAARILSRAELECAADSETLLAERADAYAREHLAARTAVAHGLIDEIVEPSLTRARVCVALASARH
jgi:acetyl-CoA carboxylase carboxyltransferase component